MTTIEKILRDLSRSGFVSFSEGAAILGACEAINEMFSNENVPLNDTAKQWQKQYGTFAVIALSELCEENKEKEENR